MIKTVTIEMTDRSYLLVQTAIELKRHDLRNQAQQTADKEKAEQLQRDADCLRVASNQLLQGFYPGAANPGTIARSERNR